MWKQIDRSFYLFIYFADGPEGQPGQRLPVGLRGSAAEAAEGETDAEGNGRVRPRKVSTSPPSYFSFFFSLFSFCFAHSASGYHENHTQTNHFPFLYDFFPPLIHVHQRVAQGNRPIA